MCYNRNSPDWSICKNLNQNIATKCLVGFSIYDSTFLENIYTRLDQLIQVSSPNLPAAIDANTIKNIADMFYSEQCIQLGSNHSSIYSQVLKTMANYEKAVRSNKEKQIDTFLSTLRIVGLAIVFVPFILLIINTSKHIKSDCMTALYTFEIMSPDTVLSNQCLLTKFKRLFKTTSY